MVLHTEVVDGHGHGRLEGLALRDRHSGATRTVPASAMFILIGAEPRTDWLDGVVERDERGYVLTGRDLDRWPLARPPLALETSLPGVFAAGDVRDRSIKRVASAAGEGSIAVQLVHQYLADAQGPGAGRRWRRPASRPRSGPWPSGAGGWATTYGTLARSTRRGRGAPGHHACEGGRPGDAAALAMFPGGGWCTPTAG